jgi:single-strand DNA-binding protein
MSVRSLNKVQLIGNLTRDPELRFTPQGTAVCSFGLATNRSWTTDSGEKREETEFHKIVAWAKLAELCSQLLFKGRRIYVEGRLQTRKWTTQDGQPRTTTEIVIDDMIILDSKYNAGGEENAEDGDYHDENDGGYDYSQGPDKPLSKIITGPSVTPQTSGIEPDDQTVERNEVSDPDGSDQNKQPEQPDPNASDKSGNDLPF